MNLRRRLAAFVMDRNSLGAELAAALDDKVLLQQANRNLSYVANIRGQKIRELEDKNRRLRENLVEMERLYTNSCDDVQFLLTGQIPMRGEGQ